MRTFLFIWFGQFISTLGSGLTGFALSVYPFQKTGSVTQLSLVYLNPRIRRVESELPDFVAIGENIV